MALRPHVYGPSTSAEGRVVLLAKAKPQRLPLDRPRAAMHQRRPSPRTHAGRRRRQGPRLLLHRADSDAAAGEEADGGKGAGASSRVRRGEELGGCAGWEVVEEPGPAGGELDHLVGQQLLAGRGGVGRGGVGGLSRVYVPFIVHYIF